MTHVCAKPACAEPVEVWFDFAPVSQKVVQRAHRTEVSVGLCALHTTRFTVPEGWAFEKLGEQVEARVDDSSPVATPAVSPKRRHHRDRPWFLALREESEPSLDGAPDDSPPPPTPRADHLSAGYEEPAEPAEPTAGSLLHRAFHGPDRHADRARAIRDHHDELESRRSARGTKDVDRVSGHGMAELPFPPYEPEHQAAVS